MGLFSNEPSGYLGVDIGHSGIKVVELKREGERAVLSSYGFSENIDAVNEAGWFNDTKKTASLLTQVLEKAHMSSRNAIIALPAYAVFTSIINLVNVDKKTLDTAVMWETKKVIPVPIEDVSLEWRLIESRIENNKEYLKIFVSAVPKILVNKYQDLFSQAKLTLHSLEPEIFSLVRSLIGKDKSSFMLIELGGNTTSLSIIERGIPVLNRSLSFGGSTVTKKLAEKMGIHSSQAEQLKFDLGISALGSTETHVPELIAESLSPLVNEIKYMINLFHVRGEKKIDKIILSGGSSLLVNLVSYLENVLDITTVIGDPWSRVSYPVELEPLLKELGPRLAVAVGLALNRVE
jgi:type IV pilus assembly protein PilM